MTNDPRYRVYSRRHINRARLPNGWHGPDTILATMTGLALWTYAFLGIAIACVLMFQAYATMTEVIFEALK